MNTDKTKLTQKKIFQFWYPLATAWLLMAVEGPTLSSFISRLADPKFNLAAYGVAFSIALLVEGPIIMLMSASTALCHNKQSFFKLRSFANILNLSVTGLMILVVTPWGFDFLGNTLLSLPPNVYRLAHFSLILLLPWPFAIGYRRFFQGILIRYGLTRCVAYGSMIRLAGMAGTASILFYLDVTGAYVGAASLSVGVMGEALAARIMVHQSLKDLITIEPTPDDKKNPLTFKQITVFFFPLAVMTTLSLGIHPAVTFFMGKSRFPIESLAVLPVFNALGFVFRAPGLAFAEVVIALMGKRNEGYPMLRKFALSLGALMTGILALVAFTPLNRLWFHDIQGLSHTLSGFAEISTKIIVLLPFMAVWISLQRSVLVKVKTTGPISWATVIETAAIVLTMIIGIQVFDMVGIYAAALSYIIGRALSNIYLMPFHKKAIGSI